MLADEDIVCEYSYRQPCGKWIAVLVGSTACALLLGCLAIFDKNGAGLAELGLRGMELTVVEIRITYAVLACVAFAIACVAAWRIAEHFAKYDRIAVTGTHLILPGREHDLEGRIQELRIPFDKIHGLNTTTEEGTYETISFTFEAWGEWLTIHRLNLPTRDAFEEVLQLVQRRVVWGERELPDYVAEEVRHREELSRPAFHVMAVPNDSTDLRLSKIKEFADLESAQEFANFLKAGGAFKQVEVRQRPGAMPS